METTDQINNIVKFQTSTTSKQSTHPNKVESNKYTLLTFLPLNFFHQLQKGPTLIFFITTIMLCIPSISPFEPWTYLIAFMIVIGVSMIKDAVENYKRIQDDKSINNCLVKIINFDDNGFEMTEKVCMDLKPGDFIIVDNDKELQADVVLLRGKVYYKDRIVCSKHCFVDTSNIDGESNLKKRNSLDIGVSSFCTDRNHIDQNKHRVCPCVGEIIQNTKDFELVDTGDVFTTFECKVKYKSNYLIANEKNSILRGSILKNTESALCLVVGVGNNTKQTKSIQRSKNTSALYDERLNTMFKLVLVLYALMMGVTVFVGVDFINKNIEVEYLNIASKTKSILKVVFSNYILYIYLIPLSLYVMLEMVRLFHVIYINNDSNLVSEDKQSICRNSNVIADLGMIDYVLTDKTGTITKNLMTLKKIHLTGEADHTDPNEYFARIKVLLEHKSLKECLADEASKDDILFIISLLACNSVEIFKSKPEGISQEEICFLEALRDHNLLLVERDESYVKIRLNNEEIRMDILGTLDFSSKRQRMTIIYKIYDKYYLLTKGSDQKLLSSKNDKATIELLNNTDFRSLVIKYKVLSQDEVDNYVNNLDKIMKKKNDRKNTGDNLFSALESNTEYLGAVFIEDELQDDVQETMSILKEAGMKIWMITGDKKETAISCAKNSSIFVKDSFIALSGKHAVEALEKIQQDPLFMQNLCEYQSVVVYRATPSEKGKMASYLTQLNKNILSIGDGNNDVSMLRNSNIGVGIMGREGTQASLSADFAIPKFKFLKDLILIYGRFSFLRYTKLALNSYYKSIVFIFTQFLYNLYSGASGKPLYNSFMLSYYNLFFTSLIPFSVALFDRDIPVGMQQPIRYRNIRTHFNLSFMCSTLLYATLQSAVIFYFLYLFTMNDLSGSNGVLCGYNGISSIYYISVIFAVVLRQYRMISFKVILNDIALCITIIVNAVSLFSIQELYNKNAMSLYHLILLPSFYITICAMGSVIYVLDTLYEEFNMYLYEKTGIKY